MVGSAFAGSLGRFCVLVILVVGFDLVLRVLVCGLVVCFVGLWAISWLQVGILRWWCLILCLRVGL